MLQAAYLIRMREGLWGDRRVWKFVVSVSVFIVVVSVVRIGRGRGRGGERPTLGPALVAQQVVQQHLAWTHHISFCLDSFDNYRP